MYVDRVKMLLSDSNLLKPGVVLGYADNEEKVIPSATYVKVKEVTVNKNGSVRVDFNLKRGGYSSFNRVYGRIYINNIAIGEEVETRFATYETKSDNYTISEGDKIQLYLRAANASYPATSNVFEIYVSKPTPEGTFVKTSI